jgi:hypothetical protein
MTKNKLLLVAVLFAISLAITLRAGGPALPSGISSLAELLALISGNEASARSALDVPSNAAAVASLTLKADINGSASQAFAGSTGTFGTLVNTPIIDTPSAAPLVLRSSGTAILTAHITDKVCADTYRSAVGASTGVTLGSSGIVSAPNQSYVYANAAVGNVSTYTNAVACIASFPNEVTDIQGEYNPSTSEFSPKVTGVYLFSVNAVCIPDVVPAAASRINIQICESATSGGVIFGIESFLCNASISDGASTYIMGNGTVPVRCTAGKFYTVVITQSSGSNVGNSTTLSWTMRVAKFQ